MPLLEGAPAGQGGWLSRLGARIGIGGAVGSAGGGGSGVGGDGAQPTKAACLRHIVLCGEALSVGTVRNFHARLGKTCELHNLYGPTEGSMTWFVVGAGCEDVLIGKPIENTAVVLVDPQYEPVPIGVPGEIVFGSCIARGYLHRDDLTAAKFVPNKLWGPALPPAPSDGAADGGDADAVHSPEAPSPKYRVDMRSDPKVPPSPLVYKTGDLAVRLGSGDLRFMGRVDRQVKVRAEHPSASSPTHAHGRAC